jgi:hypothetical protein
VSFVKIDHMTAGHVLRGVVNGLLYVFCIFLDDLGAVRCGSPCGAGEQSPVL